MTRREANQIKAKSAISSAVVLGAKLKFAFYPRLLVLLSCNWIENIEIIVFLNR